MNIDRIKKRTKCILLSPIGEWKAIRSEQATNKELILYYVLPFAALAALVALIAIWINAAYLFGLAVRIAVLRLVSPIITIIVSAVVINELAENFDSTKNLNQAFKLVVYSYTPLLLINIITALSPLLGWLGIFGLYGIYLFWVGMPILMRTPEQKRLVYVIASAVIIFVVMIIIHIILGVGRFGY